MAFDVIDRVNDPRVHLDLPAPDHAHAAGAADPRLVVSVHVRAHGELGLVLGRVQQVQYLGGVAHGVLAPGHRAGDGAGLDAVALDPHVHFGRSPDEVFPLAEVDEKPVGSGVSLAQTAKQLRGWSRAGLAEGLAGHYLEQVAALERLARAPHAVGVLAWLVVARARHLPGPPPVRLDRTLARQTRGRAPVRLEVVAAPPGALAAVIHDDEVVRQIKDEVALGRGALEPETQRLELQRQIVAESPVEPEVRIVGAVKKVNEGAKDAEHRGLPASLLLAETAARLLHAARKFAPAKLGSRHRRYLLQRLPDGPEQDLAPLAVRHEAKVPTAGHDRHGRVQKAHVPTGVTSGIL